MLDLLRYAPAPMPSGADPIPGDDCSVTWADALESRATAAGAAFALAAAVATIWLLVHQIREARDARADAAHERTDAAADRELARQDRKLAAAERRSNQMNQARTVLLEVSGRPHETTDGSGFLYEGRVTNYGQLPVTDLDVTYRTAAMSESGGKFVVHARVLPPQADLPFTFFAQESDVSAVQEALPVAVSFTDANGRDWSKYGTRQPIRKSVLQLMGLESVVENGDEAER